MEAYQRELEGLLQRFFVEDRHDGEEKEPEESGHRDGIMSKWRQREKLKTSAVALLVCLNIGVDPPDVIKISPCARLECWIDPNKQPTKALDAIGKYLQNQYERWQRRARYRTKMDPTTDDVQGLCAWARKNAKQERVLFHYNGHGVPRPTANGEIWVFNRNLTQYIPLSIYDVHNWLGRPCIYVLDCSAAGLLVNTLKSINEQQQREQQQRERQAGTAGAGGAAATDHMKGVIILAACGPYELLPQSPDLPADVFTSCLTTPLKMALRWFVSRRMPHMAGISKELIDRIPGKQAERRTPLGELNWIFTAITDTIAWNILPRTLFQKLFRQDLLVATLFRNFLLAERILQAYSCTPITYPRLPPTSQHQLWQSWDAAAESCLLQLPQLGNCCEADINDHYRPSTFFSEQLTAFEVWLQFRSHQQRPPEQLPIVLQVLLSQVHRLRALDLLARFLDLGHWAVDLALSVGIFPYVLKLLQTMSVDLKQTLVFIWAKILALDVSCQEDLVRDQGYMYFLRHIDPLQDSSEGGPPPGQVLKAPADSLAQALFVLAAICDGHPRGQELCFQGGLLACCHAYLHTAVTSEIGTNDSPAGCELLLKWVCLALGKLCEGQSGIIATAVHLQVPDLLERLLAWGSPEVRAAAVYSMTAMVHCGSSGSSSHVGAPAGGDAASAGGSGASRSAEGGAGVEAGMASQLNEQDMIRHEQQVLKHLIVCTYDASPLVRSEVAAGMARITSAHVLLFQEALFNCRDQLTAQLRQSGLVTPSAPASDSMQSAPSSPMRSARGRLHPAFAVATNLDPVTRTSVSDGHLLTPPPRISVHLPLRMLLQDLHAIREVSAPSVSTVASVRSAAAAASAATATAAAADAAGCDTGSSGSGPGSAQADSAPRPAEAPHEDATEEPAAAATAAAGAWAAGDAVRHARTDMVSLAHLSIAAEGGTDAGASPTAGTDRGPGSSAAAATSGSTLYDHLVNCLCILAMDPSPRVARYGRAVLRLNRHDIKALVQPGFVHSLTTAAPLPSMASVPLWRRAHDDSAVVTPRRTRSFQWPPWASRLAPRSRPGGGGGGGAGSTSSTQHGGSAFHPGGVLAGAAMAHAQSGAQLGLSGGSNRGEGPMILSSRPAFTLVRTPTQKEGGPTPSEAASQASQPWRSPSSVSSSEIHPSPAPADADGHPAAADGTAPAAAASGPGIISGTVVCGNSTESTSTTAVTATGTAGAPPGSPNSRSWRGGASGASGGGGAAAAAAASTGGGAARCSTGLDGLHRSPVYCLACQLFQQPLMEPDASASRACRRSEAAAAPSTSSSSAASGSAVHAPEASSGNVRTSWHRPPAVVKEANHLQQVWAACEQLRSGSSFSMAARPRVGGGGGDCTLSMALAPFEPLLVTSDSMGFVRVTDHSSDELRNAFHVATGKGLPGSSRRSGYAADGGERLALAPTQAASVLQMYCLNPIDNPLLMTCAADGAVRVWRSFAVPEKQTLCTAWQAVCIQPPVRGAAAAAQPPTVYHWSPTLHQLLAVGGSTPTLCYAWDLDHELCVQEFSVAGSSAGAGSDCASADGAGQLSIDVLEGGRQDCPTALLAGRSDGEVLLFDLRSPGKEVASFSMHCDKLAGLCFEPGGMSSLLVAAAQAGSVSFLDVRLAGGSGGELRAQEPHRALIQEIHGLQPGAPRLGPLTSLAGHPNAPLIATGSADRSVHLWDLKGGLIAGPCGRPSGPLSPGAAPSSPITCLSFHPYQPLLLAGYGDPLCCSFPLSPGPTRLSSGSASGPTGRATAASRMHRSSLSEGLPSSRDSSGSSGVAAA